MNIRADIELPKDKPANKDEYLEVFEDRLKIDFDGVERTRYENVTREAKQRIKNSPFWNSLIDTYATLADRYKVATGYDLFTVQHPPNLEIKLYKSFLEKSYRKNVLNNNEYPAMPVNGWLLPPDWFSKTNDIIRTSITVKYLDGVDFLVDNLNTLAQNSGCNFECNFEARAEGYYAAQTYISIECEVPSEIFDPEMILFLFEVEVTTQLKEVIKRLLHHHYEKRRLAISTNDASKRWQWEYKSDEFAANYLGHILHYLEGMIMKVRATQIRTGEDE